ncbi:MAG: DUF58 domain-containing protein [Proteobacteria bacterium]|nr:DUF58 domain-containing protein [Pseudomonadota bacterium]MBU1419872.1 DUF58 domain-containing protein [Pseudomonadota bacterium]MBU1456495.1 DUF58 domain-containing protein [Pseudomonadota bacterium]
MKINKRTPLPIKLRHRYLYILPTRHGLVFFAILLAILIGAINHNNNLGFILTFLLGGISFVSIFHTFRNLSGLTLLSARAIPVFVGQTASFAICVENSGPPRASLCFNFRNREQTIFDLAAGEKQTITVPHATAERGLLRPDILSVSTTYPLGLFRCWSLLYLDAQCLVYPRPVSGPTITAHGLTKDDNEGKSGGPGVDDFAGLKNYQPGDPLQHLSWKSFSRGQGLQRKVFEGQAGETIYFDLDALPGQDLEWKLSRICHMILQAEAHRMAYGLRTGNHLIEPALGGRHKRSCLRRLALIGQGEG